MNSAGCIGGLTGWKGSSERPECGRTEKSGGGGFFDALARISGSEGRSGEARLEAQNSGRTAAARKRELSAADRAGDGKKKRPVETPDASHHSPCSRVEPEPPHARAAMPAATASTTEASVDQSLPPGLAGATPGAVPAPAAGSAAPAGHAFEPGTPFDELAGGAEPAQTSTGDGRSVEDTGGGTTHSVTAAQNLPSSVEGQTLAPGGTQPGSDMSGTSGTPGQSASASAASRPAVSEDYGAATSPPAPANAGAAAGSFAPGVGRKALERMEGGEAGAVGPGETVPAAEGTWQGEAGGRAPEVTGSSEEAPDGTGRQAEPVTSRTTGTHDGHGVHSRAATDRTTLSDLARAAQLAAALVSRENGVNGNENGGGPAESSAGPARAGVADGAVQACAGSSSANRQTSSGQADVGDHNQEQGGPPPDFPGTERAQSIAVSRWEQARRSYVEAAGHEATPEPAAIRLTAATVASPALLPGVSSPVMNHSTLSALSLPPQPEQPSQAGGPAAPALETVRQVVRAMSLIWRNGIGEARVSLEPQQLGAATICLRIAHGNVTATLTASTAEARQHILLHQADLRQALAGQGLDLDRLVVTCDPDERDSRWQPARQQPERNPSKRDGGEAQFDVDA